METIYSSEKPIIYEYLGAKRRLNYNIHELSDSEKRDLFSQNPFLEETEFEQFAIEHRYAFNSLIILGGQWTRDGIINAIIRDKYRIDEMEAITNNMAAINAVFMQTLVTEGIVAATKYLKDSINDDNTKRFKEMQEWRAMAKEVAKSIIKDE